MEAGVLRGLALVAIVGTALPALAQASGPPCELPASADGPLADRAGLLARYERMPQACQREIFSACADASAASLLDFDTAAVCSVSYEALLKQGFGGNFHALIAWWREQRAQALP
jgi:hypothetical protein